MNTCTHFFIFSVPIVPNFILKLEEASQNPEDIFNDTSGVQYTVICSNRTSNDLVNSLTNGTSWIGPNFVSLLHSHVKCVREKIVNETARAILKEESKEEEYEEYGDANVKAGIMFGSKALMQMLFNPFVGPITNR